MQGFSFLPQATRPLSSMQSRKRIAIIAAILTVAFAGSAFSQERMTPGGRERIRDLPPLPMLRVSESEECKPETCVGSCCGDSCCPEEETCCNGECCDGNCVSDGLGGSICCDEGESGCGGACCAEACCGTNCGYVCDTDGDETADDCYVCDGVACAICDTDEDGVLDACTFQCDTDGMGGNDACALCDSNNNGIPDVCFQCDNDSNMVPDDCWRCDFANNDDIVDACYSHDANTDGTKESCCPTFSLALGFDDGFDGRSQSRAGVGETGTVVPFQANGQTMGSVTFSTTDATCVALSGNAWTASDHACSVQLCATADGCKQCKTLVVVEPSDITFEQQPNTCTWHEVNSGSVGFRAFMYITPADVSFNAIEAREEECNGIGIDYFSYKNNEVHPQTPTLGSWGVDCGNASPGKGTWIGGFDTIHSGQYLNMPYAAGTFTWNIPWSWKLGTREVTGFVNKTHIETIDANGNMTISKGGISKSADYGTGTSNYTDNPCVIP